MTVPSYERRDGARPVIVVPDAGSAAREVAQMPRRWAPTSAATGGVPPRRQVRSRRWRRNPSVLAGWTCGVPVIEIVLADDHEGTRAGLAAFLESTPDMTVVGQCADGGDLADLVERTHPRVALVDMMMPVVD